MASGPPALTGADTKGCTILYTSDGGASWVASPPTDWDYIALPKAEFEGLQRGFQCLKDAVDAYSRAYVGDDAPRAALVEEVSRLRGAVNTARVMLGAPRAVLADEPVEDGVIAGPVGGAL